MTTARGYLDSLTGWVASFDRRSVETAKGYKDRAEAAEKRAAAAEAKLAAPRAAMKRARTGSPAPSATAKDAAAELRGLGFLSAEAGR